MDDPESIPSAIARTSISSCAVATLVTVAVGVRGLRLLCTHVTVDVGDDGSQIRVTPSNHQRLLVLDEHSVEPTITIINTVNLLRFRLQVSSRIEDFFNRFFVKFQLLLRIR